MACLPTYKGKRYTDAEELERVLQQDLTAPASFSRGSLSLPEMESHFDDVAQYARLWKASNPTKSENDFYNHVKRDIDHRFTKAFVRAAFQGDVTYLQERQRQLRDTYGRGATEESQSVQKALASQYTEPVVKDMLRRNDLLYTKRPHEVTERDAQWVIDTYGELEAVIPYIQELRRRGQIDTAIVLSMKVAVLLGQKARQTTDQLEKERLWKLQYDVLQDDSMYARDVARGLAARRMYSMMEYDAFVYNINRLKRKSRVELSKRFKNTLDAITEQARKASTAAKYKVLSDDLRARLIQAQVQANVKQSDRFEADFIQSVLSPDQIRRAKERAAAALRKLGAPGFSVRATQDEIMEYGFYTFIEGLTKRQSWVNHMMNKGLTKVQAEQLYDNTDFFGLGSLSQLSALPDVMAAIGTPQMLTELEKTLPRDEARQIANRINSEHMRQVNEHLAKTYRRHLAQKGDKGRLVQAVMKAVELGKYDDDTIVELVANEFGGVDLTPEQLRELRERFDQAMLEPEGRNRDMAMTEVWAWVYNQNRAFSFGEQYWAFFYANILSSPGTHMLNFVENAMAIISEPMVQAVRELGDVRAKGLNKAEVIYRIFESTFRGLFGAGIRDLGRIARMGPVDYKSEFKMVEDSVLESIAKRKGLTIKRLFARGGRYVNRMLTSVDSMYHAGFYEMSNVIESARLVREEYALGTITKQEAQEKFRELLGDKDKHQQAINQAKMEMEEVYRQQGKPWISDLPVGVSRIGQTMNKAAYEQWYKVLTRAREISLKNREIAAAQHGTYHNLGARNNLFAGIMTYTNPPRGTLGIFAQHATGFIKDVPSARLVVLFINVVANVLNRQMDWTPLGAARTIGLTNYLHPKKDAAFQWGQTNLDAQVRLIKSIFGTAAMVAIWLRFSDDLEFKECQTTIHGGGPRDYQKRKELMARGWIPFSFQYCKKFYSFRNTPWGIAFSIMANLIDARRYEDLDEQSFVQKVTYSINRFASTMMSASFLKGPSDFLSIFEEGKESGEKLWEFMARSVVNSSPGVGSGFARTVQRSFDHTMYNAGNLQEKIQRNIPIATTRLKPALNAYGEVITTNGASTVSWIKTAAEMSGFNRYISTVKPDEHFVWLINNGLWPPVIGKTTQMSGVQIPTHAHYEFVRIAGPLVKREIDRKREFISSLPFPEERHKYINETIKENLVEDVKFAVLEQFNFEPTEQDLAEMKVDWKRVEARVKELNP